MRVSPGKTGHDTVIVTGLKEDAPRPFSIHFRVFTWPWSTAERIHLRDLLYAEDTTLGCWANVVIRLTNAAEYVQQLSSTGSSKWAQNESGPRVT